MVYLIINETLKNFLKRGQDTPRSIIGFIIMASFSKTGLTSAFFYWSGNFPSMMYLLKFCKIKLAKKSALPLIILN